MDVNSKICFIITMKYVKDYETYINIYVNGIQKFYENAFTLIVDNNSDNIEDIYKMLEKYNNIKIITNTSQSKYELGGYIFGIKWLIDNFTLSQYEYYVFTQDTFILTNKFDFNILKNNLIGACSIVEFNENLIIDRHTGKSLPILIDEKKEVLEPLGLYNNMDKIMLCWGCNFVCRNNVIHNLFEYIKNIIVKNKHDSGASERYMGRIIYELNEHRNFNIDGYLKFLEPECYLSRCPKTVEFVYDADLIYFQKKHQYKL